MPSYVREKCVYHISQVSYYMQPKAILADPVDVNQHFVSRIRIIWKLGMKTCSKQNSPPKLHNYMLVVSCKVQGGDDS